MKQDHLEYCEHLNEKNSGFVKLVKKKSEITLKLLILNLLII